MDALLNAKYKSTPYIDYSKPLDVLQLKIFMFKISNNFSYFPTHCRR